MEYFFTPHLRKETPDVDPILIEENDAGIKGLVDAQEYGDGTYSHLESELHDNWFVVLPRELGVAEGKSSAPQFNVIGGCFYNKLATFGNSLETRVEGTDNDIRWTKIYSNEGGFFALPFDVDNMHSPADLSESDVSGTSTDMGTYSRADATEYTEWTIGTINAGCYMAMAKIRDAGGNQTQVQISAYEGANEISRGKWQWKVADAGYWFIMIPVTYGGSADLKIRLTCLTSLDQDHVDFYCIPASRGLNNPSDLAHAGLKEVIMKRLWTIEKGDIGEFGY